MPVTAAENKINAVKRLGAKLTLYGENLSEALIKANALCKKIITLLFIHLMIHTQSLGKEQLEKKF